MLCLAHEHDRAPRKPHAAPAFCPKYQDCERHQAISRKTDHQEIKARVCAPGKYDDFLPVAHVGKLDDGDAEGSEE